MYLYIKVFIKISFAVFYSRYLFLHNLNCVYVQSTKIILVHSKCEIISKCKFFTIAPSKAIASDNYTRSISEKKTLINVKNRYKKIKQRD